MKGNSIVLLEDNKEMFSDIVLDILKDLPEENLNDS